MENKYSLTFPQKNIWLVEEFFGKSPINTIVGIFKINRDFNTEICEKAVNKMVEVNEGLRLKVVKDGDNTYQYVDKYTYFKVDYIDFEKESEENRTKIENELVIKPFDVINNPLYYFAIIRETKDSGYIFVKLHHLVADAWTYGNVATQLAEYIDMFEQGIDEEKIKPSYLEYIETEQKYISSEKFEKDKLFWEEYLEGFEEPVGLKENSNKTLIDAKRYSVKLDEKLNTIIKEFCKENKVSPYTVFMNALAIYLHRVTEKYDFIIGTPVLNRSNFKEKQTMGMFVSTMPVRFKIDEKETFLEMCKKSALDTMKLFRHQKYPYSLMLQDFRKKNNINNNLYEIMISYQNARAEYSDNSKYTTDWMFSTKVQDQFAIHIMDMDETGVLEVHFDYLVDLFEDIEIEYISKRLFTIIEDGILNNKTIETIEIMPEEEKNKILYEYNDTKRDYPKDKTVIELFEEQVSLHPDKIALVFEDKQMTYKELDDRANAVASYLKQKGIQPMDNIGVMINKSLDVVVTILAILKLGAIYIPMDANSTLVSKRHIIKSSNIKLILSDIERANIDNTKVLSIKRIKNYKKESIEYKGLPDDIINIMYTSGTTGKPKGVMISNKNIVKLVKNSNYINFEEQDVMLQTGSYTFDASTLELWNGLLNGITLHIVKDQLLNPEEFKKYIINNKVTIIFLTTAIFNQMISYDARMFNTARLLMTGGEAISIEHAMKVKKHNPQLLLENLYGPTENAVVSTYYSISGNEKVIPIGKPITNTTFYILDNKKRLLPIGVEGILYVGGDGVAQGYINNEKLTNEKFIDTNYESKKIYNTGDLVRLNTSGNITFLGRKDSEVKIKGIRVNIDEIKEKVNNYKQIQNNEVLCIKDDSGNKYLGLAIVSKEIEDKQEIKKYLKTFLPISIIPRKIIQIEELPLTANGKIDRKKLEQFFAKTADNDKLEVKYEGIYLEIYNLFKEVLEVNEIYPNDDFFELGGDSILGVNLVTKAIDKNINITYNDLYKYRTIKELGDMIVSGEDFIHISTDISNYDYTKIDELLFKGSSKKSIHKNIKDVILSGATGFLGMHLLAELLDNIEGKIYCLVRKSVIQNAKQRLIDRMNYYFDNIYDKYIDNKIIIIEYEGELTLDILNNIDSKKITHFINSLAIVKHYGDIEEFYNVNVNTVDIISEYCIEREIELIHISTLSVSGDIVETAKEKAGQDISKRLYNEQNLYLNQSLDNVYAYTKFIAERVILEKIVEHNLNARILRMGNLCDRIKDNKFQVNDTENAFSERLSSLINIGVIPEEIRYQKLDFTPVDSAAKAVRLLLNVDESQIIYHLYNNNKIFIDKLVNVLKNVGIDIMFASDVEVSNAIQQIITNEETDKLRGIMVDITKEKDLKYITDIEVENSLTMNILKSIGFYWPEITEEYLINILKRINKI